MTLRDQYVTKETVCNEIARFKGYIDDDMIARMQMAIISLPYEDVICLPSEDVINAEYERAKQQIKEMAGE